jgi:hypothetical protein
MNIEITCDSGIPFPTRNEPLNTTELIIEEN